MTNKTFFQARFKQIICTALALSFGLSGLYSQQDQINRLESAFAAYTGAHPDERIYVQTDKDFYVTGEIIWYKVHLRNSRFLPATNSRVVYLEIWNEEKAVLQQQVSAQDAAAHGSLYLPLYLGSGNYILRVYTAATRENATQHFEKPISIINPFNEQNPPKAEAGNYRAQLFPEGGRLVRGLQSRLGVKLTDAKGRYINYRGIVLKNQRDTVARFSSLKFGLGSVSFTPDSTAGYSVLLLAEDSSFQVPLPRIYGSGAVISVSGEEKGYRLKVRRSSAEAMLFGEVLVHSGQRLVFSNTLNFSGDEVNVTIPAEVLGEGISRVTVFDQNLNPVGERLLFKQPEELLPLQINSKKPGYTTREEVNTDIQSAPGADLSIAVFQLDSLNPVPANNILSSLWLSSELRGRIDSATYYFGKPTSQRREAIDNLLLTHGWRGFNWPGVLGDQKKSLPQLPGQVIDVRLTTKGTDKPAANVNLYLSVPGSDYQFYTAKTDTQGIARVVADRLYGSPKVLLVAEEAARGTYDYEILSPFDASAPRRKTTPLYVAKNLQQSLVEQSLNMQVQNVYAKEKLNVMQSPTWDSLRFYGHPDMSYLLDNYTRFPTMEEVLREYVREVQVRKRDDGFWLRMFYDANQRFFLNQPLRLVDGIPVYDSDKIVQFNPLEVRKLEVVDQRFVLGPAFADGIISFTTYKGDAEPEELNPAVFVTRYQGLEEERVFYSPQYSSADTLQRTPDFRSLLYWNANVKLDSTGNGSVDFYTGDRKGTYLIYVEGIDEDGRANYSYKRIEVVSRPKS